MSAATTTSERRFLTGDGRLLPAQEFLQYLERCARDWKALGATVEEALVRATVVRVKEAQS